MKPARRLFLAIVLPLLLPSLLLARGDIGRIEGSVKNPDGHALAGIAVTMDGTRRLTITNSSGAFGFKNVRAGTYSLTFTMLDNTVTRTDVVVEPGAPTTVDQVVEWEISYLETVTVTAASRRVERIVEAPASVTTVSDEEIAQESGHAQVPKLVEFTPGVEINQNDLYEYTVNTRGFANALSRRLVVLQDGRDTTDPFVGAPEWATIAFPLEDFDQVELLRGPSSSLYGANATSGLMSLTTKAPRYSQGGKFRMTAGELDTTRADFRWAGGLGGEWYLKALGSVYRSDYFADSRLDSVEYSVPCPSLGQSECLPLDAIPLVEDEINIATGGLRFDKYLRGGSVITFEGGTTDYSGTVFVNPGGTRGQILDVKRPWGRFNFNTEHWNVLAYYNGRESQSRNITTGAPPFALDADNWKVEAQSNWNFADQRVRLVAGASYGEEGVETLALREPVNIDEQALFAQVDWTPTDSLKLVAATRWDDSTLHDPQISPRAAVVWSVKPRHTLRFGYNEAFQVPTYVEYFLYLWIREQDTSGLETICQDADVVCGLDTTPIFFLGNETLPLEETTSFEIGYTGVLGNKALLTIDAYTAKNQNFTTTFQSQRGTPLGQVNKNYGPWVPPPGFSVPDDVVDDVREAAASDYPTWQLTNLDGDSLLLAMSVTTFGEVDTEGVDLGLVYYPVDRWKLSLGYSWFDFELADSSPGLDTILLPNMPENKAFVGLTYDATRWDASLSWRWTDEFIWANGLTFGTVESYTKADLVGNYSFNDHWQVGVNIANLFDSQHWETFGGSLLGRRALAYVTFSW